MMGIWKVNIIMRRTLNFLTKTLHKIQVNKFKEKTIRKIKKHIMITKLIRNKKIMMKRITLRRLKNNKKINRIKIKNKFCLFRKLNRGTVLMGKSTKKVTTKTTTIILMMREKNMMKNFISIISLSKKNQTSVIWTKILRKKLQK